jgi:hypothetical protein
MMAVFLGGRNAPDLSSFDTAWRKLSQALNRDSNMMSIVPVSDLRAEDPALLTKA